MPSYFVDIDPRELRLPTSRSSGADPWKLQQQIAKFGSSVAGMPPPTVYESGDGFLVVYDGVTRATRVAMFLPGTTIRVEVAGKFRRAYANDPKIGDVVP